MILRIAAALDERGRWFAHGCDDCTGTEGVLEHAVEKLGPKGKYIDFYIDVEVEPPVSTTSENARVIPGRVKEPE